MQSTIIITIDGHSFEADLTDTPSAAALWQALPLQARANRWGDEIYFSIPVQTPLEPDARDILQVGEIAYWPDGPALCLFFGPTPVSRAGEIRAAGPVNVCGLIRGACEALRGVADGADVELKRKFE